MPPKKKVDKATAKSRGRSQESSARKAEKGGKRKTAGNTGKRKPTAANAPSTEDKADVFDGRELWLATDALQKIKAMRNYFQLERDRIIAFWDVSKKQLDELRHRGREREQEKEALRQRHAIEKKVFVQKIRHLLYENHLHLSSLKEEAERTLMAKEDAYRQIENNSLRDVREVKLMNREIEDRNSERQMSLLAQNDREIAEQQAGYEREVREVHLRYEHMLRTLRDEMDSARNEEKQLIEKRKDDHVAELRAMHDRTLSEIKEYYCEITANNLEMIRTLKEEVAARKRTDAHNEKAMAEVAQRNRKLAEPLAKLQKLKKDLEVELKDFFTQKDKLREMKLDVSQADQKLQSLTLEHEVLTQRYAKLVEDRDIILKRFNDMLQRIQQKATFRRVLIQKKLELVQSQLEGRDAKLAELLRRANIDPEDIKELEQKMHDLLSEKDKTIEDIKMLLTHVTAKGENIVATYEAYFADNNVAGPTGMDSTVIQL